MAFLVNATTITHETPPVSTEKLEAALTDEDGPSDKFKEDMTRVLGTFLRLVTEPRAKYAFEGKVAPVELVMIGVLIAKGQVRAKDRELADGIRGMRDNIRANTAKGYIMWKPEVVRKMLVWIEKWKLTLPPKPTKGGTTALERTLASKSSAPVVPAKRKARDSDGGSSAEEPLQDRNVRPTGSTPAYKIPKTSVDAVRPINPVPRASSSRINGTNILTPQRVEPAPLISRETLLSQSASRSIAKSERPRSSLPERPHSSLPERPHSSLPEGPRSSRPAILAPKKEETSPVDRKPPTSSALAPAPSSGQAMDLMTLDEQLELLDQEIIPLQELVARRDQPNHAQLEALLQEKGSLKSKLKGQRFLLNNNRNGTARPFGPSR